MNTVLRCLIGLTLAIKMNVLNTLKVENSLTEVMPDLKSMKQLLLESWYALKVHLIHAESQTMFQWLPMGISLPCCFLTRPGLKCM